MLNSTISQRGKYRMVDSIEIRGAAGLGALSYQVLTKRNTTLTSPGDFIHKIHEVPFNGCKEDDEHGLRESNLLSIYILGRTTLP